MTRENMVCVCVCVFIIKLYLSCCYIKEVRYCILIAVLCSYNIRVVKLSLSLSLSLSPSIFLHLFFSLQLRLIESVGKGELQLEGCSMDEAVEKLVQCGFSSDPEEMMYRCDELDEFWKVRVQYISVGMYLYY